MTVKAALRYLDETGDVDTASRAFAQALTTEYEASYADPGSGHDHYARMEHDRTRRD